jgi:hypothetical protein
VKASLAVAIAAAALATGCMRPIAGFTRNLCLRDAVAVSTSWDAQLHRVFERLWVVAAADAEGRDVRIVAVDGPPTLPTAWTCGNERQNTIAFTVTALGRLNTWRDGESLIAITVAHELAHVVLHQGRSPEATTARHETEADTLGIFYFERAGYDCRRWVEGQGGPYTESQYASPQARRRLAEAACADARRGIRPIVRSVD